LIALTTVNSATYFSRIQEKCRKTTSSPTQTVSMQCLPVKAT
jgi:hypothetical protein